MGTTKNPFYVVKNNGVDVEEAHGIVDLILKKTGIDKLIPLFETILEILLSQVNSYPMFLEVKKVMDALLEKVITMIFEIQQMVQPKKQG